MKKKINILLILFVLGLWGTVAYRAVSRYFFHDAAVPQVANMAMMKEFKTLEKDTFMLEPLQRDPFLGVRLSGTEKPVSTGYAKRPALHNRPRKEKPAAPRQPFPSITYFGYIKTNHGKPEELVLLRVNGKLLRLRPNETKEGLKVKKINKDFVEISFRDSIMNIKKSKA